MAELETTKGEQLAEAQRQLNAAREFYRRNGPTHLAVELCEVALEKMKAIKDES
jgi:hypothetical protein